MCNVYVSVFVVGGGYLVVLGGTGYLSFHKVLLCFVFAHEILKAAKFEIYILPWYLTGGSAAAEVADFRLKFNLIAKWWFQIIVMA